MVNPNNFYTVQGWMVTELGLRGNELAAYAIIYGFSQDGASKLYSLSWPRRALWPRSWPVMESRRTPTQLYRL